jgi:hypothetical protein
LFCLLLSLSIGHAFIPHPLIAYGALTGDSESLLFEIK